MREIVRRRACVIGIWPIYARRVRETTTGDSIAVAESRTTSSFLARIAYRIRCQSIGKASTRPLLAGMLPEMLPEAVHDELA